MRTFTNWLWTFVYLLHRVVHSKFPGFLGDLPSWSLVSGSVNNVLLDIVTRCFSTFLRTVLIQVHVQSWHYLAVIGISKMWSIHLLFHWYQSVQNLPKHGTYDVCVLRCFTFTGTYDINTSYKGVLISRRRLLWELICRANASARWLTWLYSDIHPLGR